MPWDRVFDIHSHGELRVQGTARAHHEDLDAPGGVAHSCPQSARPTSYPREQGSHHAIA